jgi:hypothetical protein
MVGPLVMQLSYVSSLYLCVLIFDSNIRVLEPCFEDVTQAKASEVRTEFLCIF